MDEHNERRRKCYKDSWLQTTLSYLYWQPTDSSISDAISIFLFHRSLDNITRQILFTTAYIDTTKQGMAHEVIERLRQIIHKKSRSYKVKGMMEKRSGHLVK